MNNIVFFDTHCHTYLCKQRNEEEILEEIKKSKNLLIGNVGIDLKTSEHIIKISEKYDFAYSIIGIQPENIRDYKSIDDTMQKLKILSQNKKVIAIGECGLDYYRIKRTENGESKIQGKKQIQKDWFTAQIKLAKKINLPLVIHNREAGEDIFKILKENNCKNFIIHCFSENLDYAKRLIDFSSNCKISFPGILTFKNTQSLQEVAKNIPLKNIIIETDAPFLTPTPYRGKENYPFYVENTFNKLCELRSENSETLRKQILKNSLEVFKIKI